MVSNREAVNVPKTADTPRRPTRAELIRAADPDWREAEYDKNGKLVREADPVSHLTAITDPITNQVIRYTRSILERAPRVADASVANLSEAIASVEG